jgi:competence protein ComEC
VLAAGALVWVAVACARVAGSAAVGVAAVTGGVLVVIVRKSWAVGIAGLLVAGAISGALSSAREASVLASPSPEGPLKVAGVALDDVRPGASGEWFLLRPTHIDRDGSWVRWQGAPMLVSVKTSVEVAAGERVVVQGVAGGRPGRARGDPYAGVIRSARVSVVGGAEAPLFSVGNAVRGRIQQGLQGDDAATALLSGFLIGDIRRLPPVSADQLRRSGLSHFVAVSGSNVALFLILWWVIVGPFAFGPRRRAVVGLIGLAIFVVVTRWEPSVLRAAGMAGLLLAARAAGVALTPWVALGASVGGLLLVSGELSGDVGFQLSVAATVGVMGGADLFTHSLPRRVAAPLGATVAAQAAVAPVLLAHFGTIPLLSPLANVAASPLVIVSTAVGGIGVLTGAGALIEVGVRAAGLVLVIARVAAGWPQLGPLAAMVVGAGGLLAIRRRLRPIIAVTAACVAFAAIVVPAHRVPAPATVFLDIGQGDSELLVASGGETILIDGGPDPVLIVRKLGEYGIRRVDLMILSHPHDDHATGLLAVMQHVPVGALWHPGFDGGGPAAAQLLSEAERRGVPVRVPRIGERIAIGDLSVEVVGPLRRYASPNDQSLVLSVEDGGTVMLFPGDIEKIAQAELGPVRADVLKVPHQGAVTSDPAWLLSTGASLAIVSVGPNTFGHPSPEIIDALRAGGVVVKRTDEEGDIIVSFVSSGTPRAP